VLVLDDPLSALDVHTEEKVSRALRQVLAGTTALVVAHRPSTVALADKVALLADGVIVALGTHAELLRTQPRYRHLMSGTPGEGSDGGSDAGQSDRGSDAGQSDGGSEAGQSDGGGDAGQSDGAGQRVAG
jgi:ATP-binding cassette subfamily B protein